MGPYVRRWSAWHLLTPQCTDKAKDRMTDEIVALKKALLESACTVGILITLCFVQVKMERENDGFPLTALRELNVLRRLHHPNTIRLHAMAVGKKLDSMFYVFEYVAHDLADLVDSRKVPFSEPEVKSILLQLLAAVAYLHDNWIIHRCCGI